MNFASTRAQVIRVILSGREPAVLSEFGIDS